MEVAADRVFTLDPDPMYRRGRAAQFAVLVFAGILMVGIVLIAIRASENALPGGLDAIVLGGCILSVGVGTGIWTALGLGRGADSCQMNTDCFTLVYRNGRVARFTWNDPSLRFTVFELLSRGRPTYSIATRWPFLNPIPQELYQAILSEARSRGLRVTEHKDTLTSGYQLKIRVRAAE
jgi:hypothetical protein